MICEACKGDGRGIDGTHWVKCHNCDGTGQQPVDPALKDLEPESDPKPESNEPLNS